MGQTLKVPVNALRGKVESPEIAVTIANDGARRTPEQMAAYADQLQQELTQSGVPLTANLDQLEMEPPPQAPSQPSMLERASGLGSMAGGTVGGMVGGPVGAGIGGAAGAGYESLIRNARELPSAVVDVARNAFSSDPNVRAATAQGAAQGATEGAETALVAGGLNAGLEYGGQKVMNALGSTAKAVYRGYLKPSLAGASRAKAQAIVDAAIREGLPIAQVGKDRADQIIKELKAAVDAELTNRQHISKTLYGDIDLHQVAERVRNFARTKYYKAGRPVEDFEAAMRVADTIDAHPSLNLPPGQAPGPLPVDLTAANETKRTLQQSAGDRAFGVERSAATEAEKKGQHVLRKELETRAPKIAPLNARESKLIDVAKALQAAIEREANQSAVVGVKTIASGGIGYGEYERSHSPASAIAFALGSRYLMAPAQMSRIAILAERLARLPGIAPATAARVAIAVVSESAQEKGQHDE